MAKTKDAQFTDAPKSEPQDEHKRCVGISLLGIKITSWHVQGLSLGRRQVTRPRGGGGGGEGGGESTETEKQEDLGEVESGGVIDRRPPSGWPAWKQAVRALSQWETQKARVATRSVPPLLGPDHIGEHGQALSWPFSMRT